MTADIFTKILPRQVFEKHKLKLVKRENDRWQRTETTRDWEAIGRDGHTADSQRPTGFEPHNASEHEQGLVSYTPNMNKHTDTNNHTKHVVVSIEQLQE
jgi:hypothetical protein